VYYDQSQFDVRCEWGMAGVEHLGTSADVVVIVDVLSFTTCVDVAVGRGARVLPYRFKDESAEVFAKLNGAVLAGGRGSGSEYSLSPASLLHVPEGTKVVLPSPNGAMLTLAAGKKGYVLAGSLRNATAVAQAADGGGKILIIPAGERWGDHSLRPGIEDLVGAGAIIRKLRGSKSPEAEIAVAAFERVERNLQEYLMHCASGQELAERGFEKDVHMAASLDISTMAPSFDGMTFG
jgi:2-phosphosulfolactate phosphatase